MRAYATRLTTGLLAFALGAASANLGPARRRPTPPPAPRTPAPPAATVTVADTPKEAAR
ncbi:MAG TPA: hypothetical protein VF588_10140 [Pyrinomonadaceae bacterium]|jgi:hypothetical protein